MKETNLQKFAKLFAGEQGLDEFILENFNNQDAESYEFNGVEYYIFSADDVMEQLDEDFDLEVMELVDEIRYGDHNRLIRSIENALTNQYNYKTVLNDYNTLKNYYFDCSDKDIYIYTKK